MKQFKKILVAIDTRYPSHAIIQKAVHVASLHQAVLKIVDVVPPIPWLARQVMNDTEHLMKVQAQEKAGLLAELAKPIQEKGIEVSTEVLSGKTSVELVRELLRNNHDLLFAIAKGKSSKNKSAYGQTARQLLRQCPCPLWLVTDEAKPETRHVMGCLDISTEDSVDVEMNQKVYALAHSISLQENSELSLVHAWSIWHEQTLRGGMGTSEYESQVEVYRKRADDDMKKFLEWQESTIASENVHLIKGEPRDVIPQFAKDHRVDLVVMGTVARSGLLGSLMGNTAEHILNHLESSILALKPSQFKSPVSLKD